MRQRLRLGPGSHISYRGELVEVLEIRTGHGGNIVNAKVSATGEVRAIALHDILTYHQQCLQDVDASAELAEARDDAATVLAVIDAPERKRIAELADHVREVLTGYRSGAPLTAAVGEPRPAYAPDQPLMQRYRAKAAELGVTVRTLQRLVAGFRDHGEVGLANPKGLRAAPMPDVDDRWREAALEVMAEHTDQSRPSRTAVIVRANARVIARHGDGAVAVPSRATAFRTLTALESRRPTFRLSTKRNRDIAERNPGTYGKLRPTRPGEYLLMDTTRLDVFAMDPITLRWLQVELTVGMDWFTRCITGLRLTPVSTKSVDIATVLYQAYRPPAALPSWPAEAVWPEHGVPRSLLVDVDAIDRTGLPAAGGPAIVPATVVVDHGRVYVSAHMSSVCQRMGISIQPARLRTGRDKGPVERFFRTIREDVLQYLPGYKGPDLHSRGERPEDDAHFFIDELEAIIREWVAVVYHRRPHAGLVEPGLTGLAMSPVTMFERGLAAAGYLETPGHPDLAYEFLPVVLRTVQPYGVEIGRRRYNGPGLDAYRGQDSPYPGGRWPVHYHPDDISRVFFRDPVDHRWHPLIWEHAGSLDAPFSADALSYARSLARKTFTYPSDQLAMELLLERWNLGLGKSTAERRMCLRQSRADDLRHSTSVNRDDQVLALPSVRRAIGTAAAETEEPEEFDVDLQLPAIAEPPPDNEISDDDTDEDHDDFYAAAWEDA